CHGPGSTTPVGPTPRRSPRIHHGHLKAAATRLRSSGREVADGAQIGVGRHGWTGYPVLFARRRVGRAILSTAAGASMNGDKIGEELGKVIGTRILPGAGGRYVKMEVTI